MSGIAGASGAKDCKLVERMMSALSHRGLDVCWSFLKGHVQLGALPTEHGPSFSIGISL